MRLSTKIPASFVTIPPVSVDSLSHFISPEIAIQTNLPVQSTEGKTLDTLAQLRKLARNKYISNGLVFSLVDQKFSTLRQSYWNTYHCATDLNQEGKKLSTRHCKNRWCTQCNKIRTALLIKGYMPQLEKFTDRRFVTLTVPNVKAKMLQVTIEDMIAAFRRIKERARKKGWNFTGLRKLECTYNSDRDDYHPHFHVIIDGESMGNLLIDEWMNEFSNTSVKAQDNRAADMDATKELFKYFTKLVSKVGDKRVFHAASLDVIFKAMKGKRTFQAMGIKKISEEIKETQEYEALTYNYKTWQWNEDRHDYIDKAGQPLTGFKPSDSMKSFRIGVPCDWRGLNDEFKALKRGEKHEFWSQRNQFWEKKAVQMEKKASLVDRVFQNFLISL